MNIGGGAGGFPDEASAAATAGGFPGLTEVPQTVELRQDDGGEVRPVFPLQLRALESELSKSQRLLHGPVRHGRIEHLREGPSLDSALDAAGEAHGGLRGDDLKQHNPHGIDVGLDPQHARLLVLGVDVAEGPGGGSHPVLGGGVARGRGDESGEAHVADLGHVVAVKENVGRLEIPVDQRLGLRLVEEQQPRGDLGCYLETDAPWDGWGVATPEEAVFKAAVVHVLVDQASVLGAGAEQQHHVGMPDAAQNLHLLDGVHG